MTIAGEDKTSTLTIPGAGEITTVTIPGDAATVTLPAATVTVPTTLPGEETTSTLTIPGPGETTTVTVPGEASTVTVPTTVTLPGEDSTVTLPVTLSAETVTLSGDLATTTETAPASTVTVTATATPTAGAGSCSPSANAVVNGDFETSLPGTWSVLTAGDATLDRVTGSGSSTTFRSRIASTNSNLPQRLIQAITVCPGTLYKVSFQARRSTTAGMVSAVAYINDVAQAGGAITTSSFTSVAAVGSGIFSTTASSVILRIEFTYSGGTGSAKEIQVDNVAITPVS